MKHVLFCFFSERISIPWTSRFLGGKVVLPGKPIIVEGGVHICEVHCASPLGRSRGALTHRMIRFIAWLFFFSFVFFSSSNKAAKPGRGVMTYFFLLSEGHPERHLYWNASVSSSDAQVCYWFAFATHMFHHLCQLMPLIMIWQRCACTSFIGARVIALKVGSITLQY